MAAHDLCIGAGGTSVWERFCVGLPTIVIPIAFNQQKSAETLGRHGKIIFLGADDELERALVATLHALVSNPLQAQFLSRAGSDTVDGRGAHRVAGRLMRSLIRMRRAAPGDSDAILEWRNAESTRRHSFDSKPIDAERHRDWYKTAITDSNRALLIGELEGKPVGVVRYEFDEPKARISVYLVPGQSGRGLGPALLEAGCDWLVANVPTVRTVEADVLAENVASKNAFRDAGFRERMSTFQLTIV
jgi:RimJ/RimL family protein N-acetyltransferase